MAAKKPAKKKVSMTSAQFAKDARDTIELATQVVFDYPDWSDEHVSDMVDTFKATGERAYCDYDGLYSACCKVQRKKQTGLDYQACIEAVWKECPSNPDHV